MNYHVKTVSPDGRKASVVFHIPIPVEDNSAGKPLRDAVSEHIGMFTSQVPWLPANEVTELENGEVYEHAETVNFLAADGNAQKQAKIDARYTALTSSVLTRMREVLKFWGKDRDV